METPSAHAACSEGPRTEHTENFPVAWAVLPRALRPVVLSFYRFARRADDIADDTALPAATRLQRLAELDEGLMDPDARTPPEAKDLRDHLRAAGVTRQHARTLLQAFSADVRFAGCADWDALMASCRGTAMPVGRFLLDLHGERNEAAGPASDALCAALQILNHLQDAGEDAVRLRRIYVPRAWFAEAGVDPGTTLQAGSLSPAGRRVFDRVLDGVDALLDAAAALPQALQHWGLRLQAAVILAIANRLSRRLRRQDPLARRVALGRWDYGAALIAGGWQASFGRPTGQRPVAGQAST